MLRGAVRRLAWLSPRDRRDDGPDEFDGLVGLDRSLTEQAGEGLGFLAVAVVAAATAVVPSGLRLPVALLGASAVLALWRLPPAVHGLLETARRTRALGAAPELTSRVVLRMRVSASVEEAAMVAADRGDGLLAASLAAHVERARGTPRSGVGEFAESWADGFPELRRALLLVDAAADDAGDARDRTLDRALAAVLEGTSDRAAGFAEDLRGPATALYAFGVLLPLALVAVLPAARTAGLPVGIRVLVAVYDVLLPVVLLGASAWLVAQRPVTFPAPRVPRSHPDVSREPWRAVAAGVASAAAAWLLATLVVGGWAGPLAAAGIGAGTGLAVRFRPVRAVREHVRAVEAGLPDALYLVGRQVRGGTAVEHAIANAARESDGATGEVLAAAAQRMQQCRVGVEAAFLGEHGALAGVPSPRARSTAALLATAAEEGPPAGAAFVELADHLDRLRRVESEARRTVATVTGTLANTAVVFAPLVGGATVALADRLDAVAPPGATGGPARASAAGTATAAAAASPLSTAALGAAVGAYVLVLAGILTALATGLERGFDPALVGYRCGVALCGATPTFLASFVAAGLLT